MPARRIDTTDDFKAALNEQELRVRFGIAFGIKGTFQVAHLEVGEMVGTRTKWTRVEPMLVERERGGRADLLDQMAALLRIEEE